MAQSNATIPLKEDTNLLDEQIKRVQTQIEIASARRVAFTSYLLSTKSIHTIATNDSNNTLPDTQKQALRKRVEKAKRDNQTATHRLALSATLFTTRDPDPYAVDNGSVTGIRLETYEPRSRKYHTPSYVFLNRPWKKASSTGEADQDQDQLRYRLHRHTLPPSVHVHDLVLKYLPGPTPAESVKQARKQDLQGFVRALRRELVSLHNRQEATSIKSGNIKRVEVVNAEATDLRLVWSTGEVGRMRINDKGEIEECFVNAENGKRKRILERKVKSAGNLEELDTFLKGQ